MTTSPPPGQARPGVDIRAPNALDRWLVQRMLDAIGHPPIAFVLWNGEEIRGSESERPRARVRLGDRRLLLEIVRSPDLALGEAYADGRLEVEGDLVATIETAFRASTGRAAWAAWLARLVTWRPRFNSPSRARSNVAHHYDLGNDFYKLWLDDQLLYTCAYFDRPGMGLEEAQVAKLDHVCRKLRLRPGDRVVEAGCGWGALALHMAERYGARVSAFNLSREQIAFARERARSSPAAGRVEFIQDDYRNVSGEFDAFVSVGMLEHVGPAHYRTLGAVIDRCLAAEGRGLLHFIGHTHAFPMNAWLGRYIFPGAYIPALSEALTVLESRCLEVQDVENLRRHYGRTLEHWLERFEKHADQVESMYDERFVRIWRLYLSSCIVSFHGATAVLYQVLFSRSGQKAQSWLPWTRDDLYADG